MNEPLGGAAESGRPIAAIGSTEEGGPVVDSSAGRELAASSTAGVPERPPIASASLSVLLVVESGAKEPDKVVGEWIQFLRGLARDYEILLVESGSGGPAALATTPVARFAPAPVVHCGGCKGFGAALSLGLQHARFPLVFYTTCDEQYQPADLSRMVQCIDHADLVGGYRRFSSGRNPRGLREWSFRKLVRALFAVRMRDLGCFYLLARRSIFRRIPIQSDTSFAHVEILAKANFLGCMMTEESVSYQADSRRTRGTSERRLKDLIRVFSHPDFGPPGIPEETNPPTESPLIP